VRNEDYTKPITELLYRETKGHGRGALNEYWNAWGNWIDEVGSRRGGWDMFATLTYSNKAEGFADARSDAMGGWNKIGEGYAVRSCDKWLTEVGEIVGLHNLHYFRAMEYQKDRGVPHWHLLIGGIGGARRDECWKEWFSKYGFARILPYEAERGARFYLCKYVSKELGRVEFSQNLVHAR